MDPLTRLRYDPPCWALEPPHEPSRKSMSHPVLQDIETKIAQLSTGEKQILLDRLALDLRITKSAKPDFAATLASRAADPDIQREIHEIEQEFADAAEDGLENL